VTTISAWALEVRSCILIIFDTRLNVSIHFWPYDRLAKLIIIIIIVQVQQLVANDQSGRHAIISDCRRLMKSIELHRAIIFARL